MSVKVYSTPTCPWCTKVKEFLQSNGVAYEDIDVSKDREAAMEMVKNTKQMGVPVTVIGDRYIVGFDKDSLLEALRGAGLLA
ncbi:glutaredoxin domain-containing protein [Aminiphilus circumscriptus]|uniref:glutaredoxin domain-containing protein n=1 Tax=Aminiphilus circumscriptus TaxID=290732 RepID=UPI000492BEDC|nr:glutaredoxin domain-containing protein [Aminiphilus circumscriptus]